MEYERTEDGQIQAAFAQRAGQLLVQYDQFRKQLPIDRQFESTLTIALLQAMLTMCQELLKRKSPTKALDGFLEIADRKLQIEPTMLGLNLSCIKKNWIPSDSATYRDVIECVRHALSHPLPQKNEGLPRTGFVTELSGSGYVESYVFTQSPWVGIDGNLSSEWFLSKRADAGAVDRLRKKISVWSSRKKIAGIDVGLSGGKWTALLNDESFLPVFQVRLDIRQLRTFTAELSDYLAEPLYQKEFRLKSVVTA